MERKIYKSSNDKMIAGVCGGVAEYFNIDSTIVRLIWAILAFIWGSGLVLYIICAVVMDFPPEKNVELNDYIYVDEEKNDPIDPFSDIRRYKELFDEGIISEEEFNKKKDDLLRM